MPGYLIIQGDAQAMDVTNQIQVIQVIMDIGQAHHLKAIQVTRGASVEMATWTSAMWLILAAASAQL